LVKQLRQKGHEVEKIPSFRGVFSAIERFSPKAIIISTPKYENRQLPRLANIIDACIAAELLTIL
jgi:hypothetical protein